MAETLAVVIRKGLDQREIAEYVLPADPHEYVFDVLLGRYVEIFFRPDYVLEAISAELCINTDFVVLVALELVLLDVAVVVGLALLRGPPIHLLSDVAPAPCVVLSTALKVNQPPYFLLCPFWRH